MPDGSPCCRIADDGSFVPLSLIVATVMPVSVWTVMWPGEVSMPLILTDRGTTLTVFSGMELSSARESLNRLRSL